MIRYVAIAGTHDIDGTLGNASRWWHPRSNFAYWMRDHGWAPAHLTEPFVWDGDLDGDLFDQGSRKRASWEAAARALTYYLRALGPTDDLVLIGHSHGGNVAALALSYSTVRVRSLCTVCTPVRRDLYPIYQGARCSTTYWLHLTDPGVWANRMQVLGSLFDGKWGWSWNLPHAVRTDRVTGVGAGHSGLVRNPELYPLWQSRGWLTELAAPGIPLGTATSPCAIVRTPVRPRESAPPGDIA